MENFKTKMKAFLANVVRIYNLCGLYLLKFLHKYYRFIIMIVVTAITLFAEFKVITYPTNDLVGIVFRWIRNIKTEGFASFWKIDADYSPFFLFMCAIVSLLPTGNMITVNGMRFEQNYIYYFKVFYFLCIIGMAIGIYLITKKLTGSKNKSMIAYVITLVLPTVFMNSAIWGNSDSMLGLTLVFAIYFALLRKDYLAFFMLGLSLGNKLQAVFLIPFFAYLILNRKLKLHAIIFGFIGLCVTFIPSWICGAPFGQPFAFIGVQMGRWPDLTLGCANMWHLLNFAGDIVSKNATWIGLSLIGVVFAIVYMRKINIEDNHNWFRVMVFLIFAVIFFLPYMHERYFYMIEVLIVIYALLNPKRFYLVPLMQLSGFIAYYHYLSGKYFIESWGEDSVHIAAFINLFVFIVIGYDVFKLDRKTTIKDEIAVFENEIEELKALKNAPKQESSATK